MSLHASRLACLQGLSQVFLDSGSESEQGEAIATGSHSDIDNEMTPSVNAVCSHEACNAQTTCIVAELETIRDNYTKGRDQFQIKVRNSGGIYPWIHATSLM